MFRPFLLVGLGGSGGKTLRFVKRDVAKRLRDAGWRNGEIPEAWQFLHIDTPTIQDGMELNSIVDPLDNDEYLGLVGSGVRFGDVANQLDSTPNLDHDLVGWRIDPAGLKVPIGVGAGQFRAVGRTVAMAHGGTIRNRLINTFDRMSTPSALSELSELYQKVTGASATGAVQSPVVIVVSSLAGGTGAGLLMNVCDMINEIGAQPDGVLSLLYTPEVFGSVTGAGAGVYPNSLAAISEVLNGYWLHADVMLDPSDESGSSVPPRWNRDLKFVGGARNLPSAGPNYPFLIGLRNAAGASFSSDVSLFGMIGAAVSTWMTNLGVQSSLIAYQYGNWEQDARGNVPKQDVLVTAGSADETGLNAFQALGVARVSIGLEFFERYAAERLALDAARFLSLAHTSSDDAIAVGARLNTEDPRALARGVAELHLPVFLKRAHLAEAGPDDNMVIDELTPESSQLRRSALETAIRLSEIGVGDTCSAAEWEQRINPALDDALRTFGVEHLGLVHEEVSEWVEKSPSRVLSEVEHMVAQFGLRVTAALVRQASDYFLDADTGVVQELREEALTYRDWASEVRIRDGVAGQLQGLGAKIPSDHQALEEAVQEGLHFGQFIGNAQVAEQAAALLESFADKFLRPLAIALEQHANAVDEELRADAINWAPWTDGDPPSNLVPPPSEITLIEPEEYAGHFKSLLARSFPEAANDELQRWEVRKQIISGAFLREDDAPQISGVSSSFAIDIRLPWWPGTTVVPTDLRTQADAVFDVAMMPTQLMQRASAWMRRPNSPFAKLLSESLRTYLQADAVFRSSVSDEEYKERQNRLIPKLNQALQASSPLVDLHSGLVGTIHGGGMDPMFRRVISDLPFKGHVMEEAVESLLIESVVPNGDANAAKTLLTTDADVEYINISSTLAAACSPLVFESLLRPISSQWAKSSHTLMQRQEFWLRRRARRLEEFVPVTQEVLVAMCRGWFTGLALGIIDRDADVPRIGRNNNSPVTFPSVMLTEKSKKKDLLARVLESLSLAYVEVCQRGGLEPLQAYISLRDLGTSSIDDLWGYDSVGPDIQQWAVSGSAPGQIATPLVSGENETDRLEQLLRLLEKTHSSYEEELAELEDQWKRDPRSLGENPSWPGVSRPMFLALKQLVSSVSSRLKEIEEDSTDEM